MGDGGTQNQDVTWFIVRWLSEQLRREVTPDADYTSLGLDSLDMVRLTDAIAEHVGAEELPVSLVLDNPNATATAAALATMRAADSG